jgi:hypothetical protein
LNKKCLKPFGGFIMIARKTLIRGFYFTVIFSVTANVNAFCVYNESEEVIVADIGGSINQTIPPGESSCNEEQSGLVKIWPNEGGQAVAPSGAPGATAEVEEGGYAKVTEEGALGEFLVIYGADGQAQQKEKITSPTLITN